MSYANGLQATYRFPAASLASAAIIGRIAGPPGMSGRLTSVSLLTTTATTVAAGTLTLGDGTDADAYASVAVPITANNLNVASVLTRGVDDVIDADGLVVLTAGGEPTAGAADIVVTIEWY